MQVPPRVTRQPLGALHYGGTGVERAARGLQHCAGGLAEFVHRVPTYRPRGPGLRGLFIPREGDLAPLTPARRLPRARTHGPPGRSEGGLPAGVRGGGARARSRVPGARSLLAPKPSNSDRTRPWLPLVRLREMVSAAQCFHQQHRAR